MSEVDLPGSTVSSEDWQRETWPSKWLLDIFGIQSEYFLCFLLVPLPKGQMLHLQRMQVDLARVKGQEAPHEPETARSLNGQLTSSGGALHVFQTQHVASCYFFLLCLELLFFCQV